jgi:CO/xanthine dehydrogenase FAD-binding subunit
MRILDDFEYLRPSTIEEALELLGELGAKASPLAGGTDLLCNMKHRSILQLVPGAGSPQAKFKAAMRVPPIQKPEVLISLADLPELSGIKKESTTYWVGPSSTMLEITQAAKAPAAMGALSDAAGIMGSPLLRARATFGGNLINARPAADTAIAALAIGGRLTMVNESTERVVAISDFFTGPGTSVRQPDELLVGIEFDWTDNQGSAYFRQGTRRQLEIALVSAAAWVSLDKDGTIADARVAMGAVGPTPLLSPGAAGALKGSQPTPETIAHAAQAARGDAKPIDDFRGSADYRFEVVEVLSRRAIELAVSRAKGGKA